MMPPPSTLAQLSFQPGAAAAEGKGEVTAKRRSSELVDAVRMEEQNREKEEPIQPTHERQRDTGLGPQFYRKYTHTRHHM